MHTHIYIYIPTDKTNPLLSAATFGRADNIKLWLERFPNWDLEKEDNTGEGTALARVVTSGPDRLELIRFLLNAGSKVNTVSKRRGLSVLMFASANEDADRRILSVLLQHVDSESKTQYVNMRSRSRSFTRLFSDLLRRRSGQTAIHYAVARGVRSLL